VTAAFARRSSAAVAAALATIYLVWGSTYLAMRITDRTMPPFLMSSARFFVAGAVLFALTRNGRRPTLREWVACAIAGTALLAVGNAGVAWAETRIGSGLAALIVASIPLYVALMDRVVFGRRLSVMAVIGLVVGFAGVVLLVRPGGGGNTFAALVLLATTSAWSAGSLYVRGAPLPANPLRAASMQMLSASIVAVAVGLIRGESSQVHASSFGLEPLLAFAYLVVFGSLVAFSAYAWLLKNVRISVVATYAFVNPVVAVVLGAAFLGERITATTIIAGAAIVVAVVLIVVAKVPRARPRARPPRHRSRVPLRGRAGFAGASVSTRN
jgi:drug/metabolite transporter (DMT)-like permease